MEIRDLSQNQKYRVWKRIYYKYADGVFGLDRVTLRITSPDAHRIMRELNYWLHCPDNTGLI